MLLFLHLDFGHGADVDDGNAAGELREAFLEFFLVVIGGRLVDLRLDLRDAILDILGLARAVDDRGVILVDLHALGLAELADVGVLELEAEFFGDNLAAGKDGDVLEHGLASVAEAGRLDRAGFERSAEAIDDERREGLSVDVLGDDEERATRLRDLLEQGKHVLHVGDFLVVNEDVGILEDGFHAVAVGHEIRRDIPAVELHSFHEVGGRVHRLRFLDGDDAVLSDLLDGVGKNLSDFFVVVRRNGGYVRNLVRSLDFLGVLLDFLDRDCYRLVDAPLELDGGHAGGDRFKPFPDHGVGKDGRRGGSVSRHVVGLRGDFF